MNYGKLIDGEIIYAPTRILQYHCNDKHICVINPTPNDYINAGYKTIVYQDIECIDNSISKEYGETDDNIIVYNYTINEGQVE